MNWLRISVVLSVGVLFASPSTSAHDQDAAAAAVVEKAGAYVQAYLNDFTAVVSEERQTQRLVRTDGRVSKTRLLRSDFLLIKRDSGIPQVFRDVLAVDNRPVRNHDDRLRKLFLEKPRTAAEQARAIDDESARHNLGVPRTGNSPMLPLLFLDPRRSAGSRFTFTGSTLAFEEVRRPSLVSAQRNSDRYDLPSRGTFEIEIATGRVLACDVTADASQVPAAFASSARFAVTFREDEKLKLMVPVTIQESYWNPRNPKADRLEAESTYATFRRFQVTVSEIKK